MLLNEHGDSKPIELLMKNVDRVLARPENDPDGPLRECLVEEVFERQAPLFDLRVGGRTVRATAEHPFWVNGRGWTVAGELIEGDRLASHDGQSLVLESISATGELAMVYNVSVEGYHTYYVGSREWGFSIWAHNYYGTQVAPNNPQGLSGLAVQYRIKKSITNPFTNVSVIQYVNRSGKVKYTYGIAVWNGFHAEKNAFNALPKYVKNNPDKYIQMLYTERSPCPGCENSMQGTDSSQLKINLPANKVQWSFQNDGPEIDNQMISYINSIFP